MCWTSNKIPVKRIAVKDITVYKVLLYDSFEMQLYSPYFGQKVSVGQTVNADILMCQQDTDCYTIDEGIHSYNKLSRAREEMEILFMNRLDIDEQYDIYKCIIPKSSEYYINQYHEVVSNHLIYKCKI